ncbi:serine/threonine protein phosphatase [Paludicola sp. MB14-C6]|uniref:serine/threonine protein phosphatase n=1 Tax=Paludihabitans sp. MB14-C6 TaxID=3070656 RepID=UPI0027DCFA4D|nr:serine/threonine protein phosphatase [Paludicola sp. MB14-C6]WMJ23724.1 serine/threonine protein phosphatase [Paludicola sp. MB14-C6]
MQTARSTTSRFSILDSYFPLHTPQNALYDALRESVPIIDAAIMKIIRLTGGFTLTCSDKLAQSELQHFTQTVKVGGASIGLESFICTYLENLLLYGNAVGEIVLNQSRTQAVGLYNASLNDITLKQGRNALEFIPCVKTDTGEPIPVSYPEYILFTALNPKPSDIYGNSLLKGLPFVASVLMKIYECIGNNFERIGNVRYAVTYRPKDDTIDPAVAKERATQIAQEWSNGINAAKNGQITDFISVGDVSIQAIGSDNQIIDTNIPVRQMLEQMIAKLGLPPFLLGLNWSTTERMSKQQADILTSELEYYRRLLTPIIQKICNTFLRLNGYSCGVSVSWSIINLQDEIEHARAAFYNAQAEKINRERGDI